MGVVSQGKPWASKPGRFTYRPDPGLLGTGQMFADFDRLLGSSAAA
jgi:hypothetical protein